MLYSFIKAQSKFVPIKNSKVFSNMSHQIILSFVFLILGLAVGFAFYQLAKHQIKVRCEKMPELAEKYNPGLLRKKWVFPVWEIAFALLYFLSYYILNENIISVIFSIIFVSCAINIIFIDLAIRRIPNELLAIVLIVSLICNIASPLVYGESLKNAAAMCVIGLVVGFVLFLLPQKFGIYIGSGDIKLSAVIGFALGAVGYLQAMVIMALIMLIYLLILLITKKGGMKTMAPMGPALSAGAIITVLFPILSNNIVLFK